ncbi:unnamed protein product [Ilex paraguariensis]|uniref:Uncharacterized protein n=1 Tax=Ilex paraguariensis TaxID=185542 RepID=A0ABC8URZ3_9AQUA
MELQHFSHEHPLIPMEVPKEKGGQVTCCAGCLKPILGAAYSCTAISNTTNTACYFFLHKRCAELPDGIKTSYTTTMCCPFAKERVVGVLRINVLFAENIVVTSTTTVAFAHFESAFHVG